MAEPSQIIFINGPTLASVKHRGDLHRLRSNLITRGIGKQQQKRARTALLGEEKASTSLSAAEKACTIRTAAVPAQARGKRPLYPRDPGKISEVSSRSVSTFFTQYSPGPKIALTLYSLTPASADPRCQQLVEYCIHVLWPGFRVLGNYPQQFYCAWIPQMASNPHLLHAMLCCASLHRASNTEQMKYPGSEQLRHRIQAIQSIRNVVSTSKSRDFMSTESLLIAMLFLAMCNDKGTPPKLEEECDSFTPPLKNLQWLSHYARSPLHPVHWEALQALVSKQGGIGNLKTYGLPWLLSYASLIQAATTLSTPVYPLHQPDGEPYSHMSPLRLSELIPPGHGTSEAGIGFRYLQFIGVREDLVQVFVDLSELSNRIHRWVDSKHSSGESVSEVDYIGDCRNHVQHRILSLPRLPDANDTTIILKDDTTAVNSHFSLRIYETFRIAALLYSTSVTFPIPLATSPQMETVLRALQDGISTIEYQRQQSGDEDAEVLDFLLWFTIVGGIAATADSASPQPRRQRLWFEAQVGKLAMLRGIRTWCEMTETVMNRFAWMKRACDVGGLALWTSVQRFYHHGAGENE